MSAQQTKKDYAPRRVRLHSGKIAKYKEDHIRNKILKLAASCKVKGPKTFSKNIAGLVTQTLTKDKKETPSGNQISDTIEEVLLNSEHKNVAKKFILERAEEKRLKKIDNLFSETMQVMDDYLGAKDWRVKENSNMTYSLQGLNNHLSSSTTAKYWLDRIYPSEIADAHKFGYIHIHDLGSLACYCCGWDLEDLLMTGITGVPQKTISGPATHFSSILGQIMNFLYMLQGEIAGAVALSNFDTLLAPFIKKDGLNQKQVKQGIQEFVYNMNSPLRTGFQQTFSNITMDMVPSSLYADRPCIIGGKQMDFTYKECAKEMEMINIAFAETMMEGDSRGAIHSFPIPTYNITDEFIWDSPAAKKVWEMTAKLGVPYFANMVNSGIKPEDIRSMCCRISIDNRELRKRLGGIFASAPLTGSVGVCTLNLPRLAYISSDKEEFFENVEAYMEVARDSLEIKRKILEDLMDRELYPYSKFYLRSIKQRSGAYYTNHFSTVGLVGMHEACLNLLGDGIQTKAGKALAIETLTFMKKITQEFQVTTGNLYNLEATPAEGACYRLAKADQKSFGAEAAHAGDKIVYYTNSTHLPVGHTDDLFKALDHQDELQCLYTGGTVLHSFLGESAPDPEALAGLIKKITSKYKLPYISITPTFTICEEHGYLKGEHHKCPHEGCIAIVNVYSRVVGYYRPVSSWNDGKKSEYGDRRTYCLPA